MYLITYFHFATKPLCITPSYAVAEEAVEKLTAKYENSICFSAAKIANSVEDVMAMADKLGGPKPPKGSFNHPEITEREEKKDAGNSPS